MSIFRQVKQYSLTEKFIQFFLEIRMVDIRKGGIPGNKYNTTHY